MGQVNQGVYAELTGFNPSYSSLFPLAQAIHSTGLWTECIELWSKQMGNRHYAILPIEILVAQLN